MEIKRVSLLVLTLFCCSLVFGNTVEEKLAEAILSENIVRMRVLLRQVNDINQLRHEGQDLLTYAITNGKKDAADYLRSQGAVRQKIQRPIPKPKVVVKKPEVSKPKPKPKPKLNWNTALTSAKNVRSALNDGANPNATFNGESVLHYAANQGRASVVDVLIQRGANKDTVDSNNRTVLHVFAQSLNGDGIRVSLKHGVNSTLLDNAGNTYKTYLLSSISGQTIFDNLQLNTATIEEMRGATRLSADARDFKALKNLLIAGKGNHGIEVTSELLTSEKIELALTLNRFSDVKPKQFYPDKTFYQTVQENFESGYYLVTMGVDPMPASFADLRILEELCKTQDVMPMLAAGGVTAATPMTKFYHKNVFEFISSKCQTKQSIGLTEADAKQNITSMIISEEMASILAIGATALTK